MKKIVLLNDDVNSFEGVIESLVKVCNHNRFQAEQCALLVHSTGRCDIKTGEEEDVKRTTLELKKRGLRVRIVSA
jgi:ATP-dependent Clp protease adaptor protein ClpS